MDCGVTEKPAINMDALKCVTFHYRTEDETLMMVTDYGGN